MGIYLFIFQTDLCFRTFIREGSSFGRSLLAVRGGEGREVTGCTAGIRNPDMMKMFWTRLSAANCRDCRTVDDGY